MHDHFPALNAERLWTRIETLAAMTAADMPWTRRAFSPLFQQARDWLSQQFSAAGLSVEWDAITTAAGQLGYASIPLPSGAGHDAVYMAASGPMGMIFVPCLNGRSHCPQEWLEPDQLLDGTRVLYQTVLELDQRLQAQQIQPLTTKNTEK